VKQLRDRAVGPASAAPHSAAVGDHLVEFYPDVQTFAHTVADHLAPAWDDPHGIAMLVARPAYRDRVRSALAQRGLDTCPPDDGGRLLLIDAATAVDAVFVDGAPDPDRFREQVGDRLRAVLAPGASARVCGEMVALLWEGGDVAGAMALEQVWNDQLGETPMSVLCPYPASAFDDGDDGAFHAVCRQHHGLAPEGPRRRRGPAQRLRTVARLDAELRAGSAERQALRDKQAELETALQRLRELDRLRNEFVAMVVHDIRNPTATITAALDMLRDAWRDFDDDEVEALLATATKNARHIERLTTDMLTVAGLDAGDFRYHLAPTDLGDVVRRAVVEAHRTSDRHFEVTIPSALPKALADEDRQTQILGNLLGNAVKFSPADTTVRVAVVDRGDRLAVSVADRGRGIPEGAGTRLFEPFYRVRAGDRNGAKGTGLGLYIAKSLVEGQGGEISVDSRPGEGATFTYTVPTVGPSA
jgi:signal transduction histidine kinase